MIAKHAALIEKLGRQVAELEARKGLHDAGIWRADKAYDEGCIVSHAGSAWVAKSWSEGIRPGENSQGVWRMFVKRGRDGRHGKPARNTREIDAMA